LLPDTSHALEGQTPPQSQEVKLPVQVAGRGWQVGTKVAASTAIPEHGCTQTSCAVQNPDVPQWVSHWQVPQFKHADPGDKQTAPKGAHGVSSVQLMTPVPSVQVCVPLSWVGSTSPSWMDIMSRGSD
jgi:hypothetical protein